MDPYEIRLSTLLKVGFIGGAVISAMIIIFVISTGQTFGQRCVSAGNIKGSPEWLECVQRLSKGGDGG